jgi:hypothetical protein
MQALVACAPILRWCPDLRVSLLGSAKYEVATAKTATAALTALGKAWELDPSLRARSPSSVDVDIRTNGDWKLELYSMNCTRAALSQLPQGLTHLELM